MNERRQQMRSAAVGFTLIEALVAVGLVALIAAIALPLYLD